MMHGQKNIKKKPITPRISYPVVSHVWN